jgi:hypothetical protein
MSAALYCPLCQGPIDLLQRTLWKEVKGFVGGPKSDSMVLRTDTGRMAHDDCIEKAKHGQAPDQETLL